MDTSKALGEEGDTTYMVAMSNLNKENTNARFTNEVYGGIRFDQRYAWNVAMLKASFPLHDLQDDAIATDIWYKRWHLGEESPVDGGLYSRLHSTGYFMKPDYTKILDVLPRIQPVPSHAQEMIDYGANVFPNDLTYFLNFVYWQQYPYELTVAPKKSQGFLGIKVVPGALTTDTFDVAVQRTTTVTTDNSRSTSTYCYDKSEGGYVQYLRVSRTLATLLGIDDWEEQQFYPRCSYTVPGYDTHSHNITKGVNDELGFMIGLYTEKRVTFPPGHYTLESFNATLQTLLPTIGLQVDDCTFTRYSTTGEHVLMTWVRSKFYVLLDAKSPHTMLGFDMGAYYHWDTSQTTAISQHIAPILTGASDAQQRVTDYQPQVWLSPSRQLDPFVFNSVSALGKTLQSWGLVGAKLCLSNRTYCVTILYRSYTKDTPYTGAYSSTDGVLTYPPVLVQDALAR